MNRTYRGPVPPAELSADAPPPIILLEFGVNGVSWVDVLLKRLRQRFPHAILVYVDLTPLHPWRAAALSGGRASGRFVWSAMWEKAPTCTTQLQTWLQQTGCEFWSMRAELRRLHVSYDRATGVYYHADKKHLKQAGHTLIGRGVADLIGARLRGAARDSEAYPRHARAAGSPSVSPSSSAQLEERCFLWYRSGLVDRRLDFASAPIDADADPAPPGTAAVAAAAAGSSPHHGSQRAGAPGEEWRLADFSRGARLRQEVGTREVGKWAFVIDDAHNATPLGRATTTATLSLHFTSSRNHSGLFVAYMLDCCIYGSARAALDGKPFGPLLHGSAPGFRHHVLHAQRLGSVARAGRHRLSFRLVRASPTGAQRFRLGGLFVVPEPAGAEYETDYKWVLPKYSRP